MAKILIIGGTGMLGRPVAVRLVSDGHSVRVFTTSYERARRLFSDKVEYAEGDVDDLSSLRRAMEGCEGVYVNLKGGPNKLDYIRIEREGSKNIYSAAIDCDIERVVQISEAHADWKHAYFLPSKVKVEAEKELVSSGLTYTILKPTWFCESLSLFMRDNKAVFVGSGKASFHFLAAADYARIVSECFSSDKADNKVLTIFGPEPMPIPEAMRRFLAVCYPDVRIERLPIWLAKMSAAMAFNKNLKAAVRMMAFFDKHDDSEVAVGPEEADAIFGRSTTTVEEWAHMYRKIVKGV